jgi:hypothetical protein
MTVPVFALDVDPKARKWLDSHPAGNTYVIAYDMHRCCGGGKLCQVKVRELSKRDKVDDHVHTSLADGTSVLIDRRAASRLPSRFSLTVRGFGRMRHLDLDLDGDQWGELLYT